MPGTPTPEEDRISYDNAVLDWDKDTKLGTLTLDGDVYAIRVTTELSQNEDGEQIEVVTAVERLGTANAV
jgi:hypothetical protein